MSIQTKIITDSSYFETNAQEWQDLLSRSITQPFFLEPSYQKAWWSNLGEGDLTILEVRTDAGLLVGLAPLYAVTIDQKHRLRIVGAVEESDYLDILVDREHTQAVYESIATTLSTEVSWDELWLESIVPDSKTLTTFKSVLQATGAEVTQEQQDVTPKITLPPTWDEYLSHLDPSQSKNFRHLMRSIGEEDEITYSCHTTAAEVDAKIDSFIDLHKASSQEKASFWTPQREAFFKQMSQQVADAGFMRLYFLYVNGDPAATIMMFNYQQQFLGYNSGFSAYRYGYMGVSNALFLHVIQDAISLHIATFDFMRGDEPYKIQFGATAQPVFDLKITHTH